MDKNKKLIDYDALKLIAIKEKGIDTIYVLASGGNAPGMDAAIRAVTLYAHKFGLRVMGIMEGYHGLLTENFKELTDNDVSGICPSGATYLYSKRDLNFAKFNSVDEDGNYTSEEAKQVTEHVLNVCKRNNIRALVVLGGDGSFRGGRDLANRGVYVIGIPCTIDNDISCTDMSIGVDSAINTVLEFAKCLEDTSSAHARLEVIEVMGRGAGYIALEAAIACGAVDVAIPERPFNEDACIEKIKKLRRQGQREFTVIVAEGVGELQTVMPGIKVSYAQRFAARLDRELNKELDTSKLKENSGLLKYYTSDVERNDDTLPYRKEYGYNTPFEIETKYISLAHTLRGGTPTLYDRLLASQMGKRAVDLIVRESEKSVETAYRELKQAAEHPDENNAVDLTKEEKKNSRVVCTNDGDIIDRDVNWALDTDVMYKGKGAKEDYLKYVSAEDIKTMKIYCDKRRERFNELLETFDALSR